MRTATLQLTVRYDPNITDAEAVAAALDTLIETAASTPGILSEYGDPIISETEVVADATETP